MSAKATCGPETPAISQFAGQVLSTLTHKYFAGLLVFSATLAIAAAAIGQTVPCTCRYKGEDYGLGDSICLRSPDGLRMATCSMILNNTSWQFSNAPCPVTGVEPQDRPGRDKKASLATPGKPAGSITALLRPAQ